MRWLFPLLAALGFAGACDDSTSAAPLEGIRFRAQPADVVAGQKFNLTVELLDANGRLTGESGRPVSLNVTGDARLSGPVTVNARAGVATFTDLAITSAKNALVMTAGAGTFSVSSAPFNVRAAGVSGQRSSFFPDSIVFITGVPMPIAFTFTDPFGNPIGGKSVSLTSSAPSTSLNPGSGTTDENGVFTTTVTATSAGTTTFTATIDGTPFSLASYLAATEFCPAQTLAVPGSVSGTLPVPECDVSGRPATVYRFTKSGGGGVAFTATASFTPRIEVKTSLIDANVAVQPTPSIPSAEWLLPDGTFLLRLASLNNNGSFTVNATPIAGTSGVTTRFLAAPGIYTGQSLTTSDRQFGDGTVYDYFVIYSTRPCTITLRATAFDAVLWMENAIQQVFVGFNDNGGGGTDARVSKSQCNDGGDPIGIFANSNLTPAGGTATGAYTLTVEFPPASASVQPARSAAMVHPDTSARDLSHLIRMKREAVRRK